MRNHVRLFINGTLHQIFGDDVGRTLSDFLRHSQRLVGTKIVCSEGDCGACTVLVGRPIETGGDWKYQPIDSCIAFLYQLDGSHIITVEGLSGPPPDRKGHGPLTGVQQAMIDCHGSQCGFCTPGFVMSLHAMVECCAENELSEEEMRLELSGNLCRCTGYSQIIDAGKRISPQTEQSMNTVYPTRDLISQLPVKDRSPENTKELVDVKGDQFRCWIPATLDEAIETLAKQPTARIVAGATDVGVQFNHDKPVGDSVIYLGQLPELQQIERQEQTLTLGSCVTWTGLLEYIKQQAPTLDAFHEIIARFGSPQIRNMGTVGGNLVNASPIADSIPGLLVHDAHVELTSQHGGRIIPLQEFYLGYKKLDLRPGEILTSVRLKLPSSHTHVHLEKVSKRYDMDISSFTAAIALELRGREIHGARVAMGGVGPTVVRAPKTEAALLGCPLSVETMRAAGEIAREEIEPISDVRGKADYRRQLAENVMVKAYHGISAQLSDQRQS